MTIENSLGYIIKCKRQRGENARYATNYIQKEDL